MKSIIALVASSALFCTSAYALKITGQVKDAVTQVPVAGASVELSGPVTRYYGYGNTEYNAVVVTDAAGQFEHEFSEGPGPDGPLASMLVTVFVPGKYAPKTQKINVGGTTVAPLVFMLSLETWVVQPLSADYAYWLIRSNNNLVRIPTYEFPESPVVLGGVSENGLLVGYVTQGGYRVPVVFGQDAIEVLPPLAPPMSTAERSEALDANNSGQIVGASVEGGKMLPVIWRNRRVEKLALPAPYQSGKATEINNEGVILGFLSRKSTSSPTADVPVSWDANGVPTIRNALEVTAIADGNIIVGAWEFSPPLMIGGSGWFKPVVFRGAQEKVYDTLPGVFNTRTHDVNVLGDFVGTATSYSNTGSTKRAFLGRASDSALIAINHLISPHQGYSAKEAWALGTGLILGIAVRGGVSVPVSYSMACPGDVNVDGQVNALDNAILSANYNSPRNTFSRLDGDLTGDARVDAADRDLFNQYNGVRYEPGCRQARGAYRPPSRGTQSQQQQTSQSAQQSQTQQQQQR